MRGSIRRVAFVGDVEVAVSEELRGLGFRVEQIESDSIVRAARELVRMRPTLVHARKNHLKVGLVAHLLNIPFVVQAGTRDVNGLTARAARMARRMAVCIGTENATASAQSTAARSQRSTERSTQRTSWPALRSAAAGEPT